MHRCPGPWTAQRLKQRGVALDLFPRLPVAGDGPNDQGDPKREDAAQKVAMDFPVT
jgi:hypothetical protein